MIGVVLGIIAFGFLYVFDLNKIFWKKKFLISFFGLGFGLLGIATFILFLENDFNFLPYPHSLAMLILAFLALLMVVYALFGALPFKKTYLKTSENEVIKTGLYGICRHPGVWFFGFLYLFLYLSNFSLIFLSAFISWFIMDIIHVAIQDAYIFPYALKGYRQYQKEVPFLVPTLNSIKKLFERKREDNDTK